MQIVIVLASAMAHVLTLYYREIWGVTVTAGEVQEIIAISIENRV